MSSQSSSTHPPRYWRSLLVYTGILAACVGAFFLLRSIGETLPSSQIKLEKSVAAPVAGKPTVNVGLHVLATMAAVIALGYTLGRLFQLIGQPPVIGEVVAGIMLGPSVLGAISPQAMHWLIPGADTDPHQSVITVLKMIAELGVIFYMFLVGLELNGSRLRHQARAAIAISHASIAFPFLLGSCLALWLFSSLSPAGVPFTSFALFMGIAMSITAFPVLARILTDRNLQHTDLGIVALGCAATDDVTAWCLLALVVGIAQTQVEQAVWVLGWSLLYLSAVFFLIRPVLQRWVQRFEAGPLPGFVVPLLLTAVLLSALTTEAIGIHSVFGAFLLGAVIPHDSRIAREFTGRLRDVVTVLLLPAFFAVTGMRTQINLISGAENWLFCGAIILVATLGKFGGTVVAARLTGQDWRMSAALGTLMNTRGLMELIVLNIGLSLGVISPALFAMMVLMALATTMATAPVLRRLI